MTIVCNRESNNSTMLRAEQFASARSSLLSVKSLTPQDRNEGPETGRSASQEPAKSPLPCTLRTGEYGPVLTASRWRMLSKYSSAVATLPLTGWNLYRQIVLFKLSNRRCGHRPCAWPIASAWTGLERRCCQRDPSPVGVRDAAIWGLLYGLGLRRSEATFGAPASNGRQGAGRSHRIR